MLSHRAPGLCRSVKCFRIVRRSFAGVQNAFAACAGTLQGCKMLSQVGKRLYKGVKCFPGLGNDFTRVQNAFPIWETTLQG